jgi:hypothetical protein
MKEIRGIEDGNPDYSETDNAYFEETKTPMSMITTKNDRTNSLDILKKDYY